MRHLVILSIAVLYGLLLPPGVQGQKAEDVFHPKAHRETPASEVIAEGLISYGNYKIFASGYDCKLYTAGVEWDRHSWGYLLRAQMDWVGEVLPVIVLKEPSKSDIWGNPQTTARQYLYGVGFSPIGFRMQWRPKRMIHPYLEAKGGILAFNKKAISEAGTYENFTLQSGMGMQVTMTPRVGLRLGLFSDFHMSNAFIVPVNPGLDVMNANIGVSYHFGNPDL